MASKDKVAFSGTVSAIEAAEYLESLAKGIRDGSMLLESGDTSLTLELAQEVKLDVEAAGDTEKGKSSVELSLSWRQRRSEDEAAVPARLTIVPGAAPVEAGTFAE
jgi:amphi-Trp domain-containing protein